MSSLIRYHCRTFCHPCSQSWKDYIPSLIHYHCRISFLQLINYIYMYHCRILLNHRNTIIVGYNAITDSHPLYDIMLSLNNKHGRISWHCWYIIIEEYRVITDSQSKLDSMSLLIQSHCRISCDHWFTIIVGYHWFKIIVGYHAFTKLTIIVEWHAITDSASLQDIMSSLIHNHGKISYLYGFTISVDIMSSLIHYYCRI